MNENLKDIEFRESYILGWNFRNGSFILYAELLLNQSHPQWENFDPKQEFGCYKLAILTFYEVENLVGVTNNFLPLKLNKNVKEYYDYGEIESFEIHNKNDTSSENMKKAKITSDFTIIEFNFLDFKIEIVNSQEFT